MVRATMDQTAVPDRRVVGRETIQRLLLERRQMLVLFCRAAGLDPYPHEEGAQEVLPEFCRVLIDYVAAAHFSLYRRIVDGVERRQALIALADELYPQIEACTETALVFNDKYDAADHAYDGVELSADLSELGEALAKRIELEDRLIDVMIVPRAPSPVH